jgi:hypothetical protein
MFPDFSRIKHVTNLEFVEGENIHFTMDFNVVPFITLICIQVVRNEDKYQVRIFDELCLESPFNRTEAVVSRFKSKWLEGRKRKSIMYYGDASGRNNSTNSYEHNYDVVDRVLQGYLHESSNRVLRSNPNVSVSRDFVNKILSGGFQNIEVLIDNSCVNTIRDLEFLKEAPDGGKLIERVKDDRTGQTYEKYGHCSDALTYFFVKIFEHLYERDKYS